MEGVPYNIFTLNEADYQSKIMETYGTMSVINTQEETSRVETLPDGSKKKRVFRYIEPFSNHFKYRHQIDDHNNLCHQEPSIESTWSTHEWSNRVFAFLIAITEVNAFKFFRYFVWKEHEKMSLHKFRKELALNLIYNDELDEKECQIHEKEQRKKQNNPTQAAHSLMKAPIGAHDFVRGEWKFQSKRKYPERTCTGYNCKNRVPTYCSCDRGRWMCVSCWGDHRECVGGAKCM